MFRDNEERQRAREAVADSVAAAFKATSDWPAVESCLEHFDRLYPPIADCEDCGPGLATCHRHTPPIADAAECECRSGTSGGGPFVAVCKKHLNQHSANATPSPAFAAAVLAFGNAEVDCGMWDEEDEDFPHPYRYYLAIADAARAALVKVHLEEVDRGR